MKKKIRISGTGCALADFLYTGLDFKHKSFLQYQSHKPGDGGLSPGKLVFTEELEKFAGKPYPEIIHDISGGRKPDTFNIGGPSLVSLIHAAQVLDPDDFEVLFYGISGRDDTSEKIRELLTKTPVDTSNYHPESNKPTPFTHVLSDPGYDNGHGERTFINNIGAARDLQPESLPASFFSSDIVCFGGTALTPSIHDNLHLLLARARENGAVTIVNTVYDFRNEKQHPHKPWPLGDTNESLRLADLLVMDNEEALKISGASHIEEAADFFKPLAGAFAITRGSQPVLFHSSGKRFAPITGELPVSKTVTAEIQSGTATKGDTTGCGDNFTGGIIAAVARQLLNPEKALNLKEAVISGICAGGFACFYKGGTYFEKRAGDKKQQIDKLVSNYKQQQANG